MKPTSLLLLAATLASSADTVSWNLNDWGDSPTGATPTAGVVDVPFWNDTFLDGGYPMTDLRDSTGATTTLDISWSSNAGQWNQGPGGYHLGTDDDGTLNREVLWGYVNGLGAAGASVTLSEIPYVTYDVYVYFAADDETRTGTVTDGTTTYSFGVLDGQVPEPTGNALFAQTTDTGVAYPEANYAVFSGLSGATQTFSTHFMNAAADADDYGGITAIQIVGTLPEMVQIVTDPANQSVAVDADATFSVAASGDLPHTFQWEYSTDGSTGWSPLGGETNSTLGLIGVSLGDEGFYRVVVTGAGSSATSAAAELDAFYAAPEFFEQPSGAYAVAGTTVTFTADATTYGLPSYQWFKDGNPMPGETDFMLELAGVGASDEGDYVLRVTDDIEPGLFADSEVATLVTFPAWTGLFSEEPFDTAAGYALGVLPAQNPSITGYSGPWEDVDFGDAEPAIMAGSLSYPDPLYLGASGDMVGKDADLIGIAVEDCGRTYRLLSPELVVADNTSGVRYLSFLYRNGNENAADAPTVYSALGLYDGDTADGNRHFEAGVADDAGLGANLFSRVNNDGLAVADFGALDSDVHLFVVKFDLSADAFSDSVTVWMDPTLGSGDAAGGTTFDFRDIRFDRIAFSDYASNSMAWDEVRWGDSFDGVTLNPSPPMGYAGWIAGYDVGDLDGFDDDADGDGYDNGTEYYLGTDPSAFTERFTGLELSGSTFSFQHPQNGPAPGDVSAGYRWSTDLSAWNDDGAASGGTTVSFSASPDTPVAGTTTVTGTIVGTIPGRLFVNLEVLETAP